MNMKTIEERVKEVVSQQLNVPLADLKKDASFSGDLGADSLDSVELVMALEEEFGQEIPDEAAEKLATVADAIHYIEDRVKESA